MLSSPVEIKKEVQLDLWGEPIVKTKKKRKKKSDSAAEDADKIIELGEQQGSEESEEDDDSHLPEVITNEPEPVQSIKPFEPIYIPPRYYQSLAVNNCVASLQEASSALVVMATGTGKTPTAGYVLKHFLDSTDRDVLAIAHREELIEQMYETFRSVCWPYTVAKEIASQYSDTGNARPRVVVASKDTLWKERRLARFEKDRFSMLFIDEAHHYARKNKTYHSICQYFHNYKLLGATATPDRGDGYALGMTFESVAFVFDLYDAIVDGWLVRPEQEFTTIDGYDISHIPTNGEKELSAVQVATVLEKHKPLVGIAKATIEASNRDGQQRQTIIFCQSVRQAKLLASLLNHTHARHETGIAAAIDEGTDKELRRSLIAMYKRGEIRYLVNFGIFTEGFDTDSTEVIVIARPVKSRALYAQMVGRGTRPLKEIVEALACADNAEQRKEIIAQSRKKKCTVIDLVGVTGKHKLVTVADILGGDMKPNAFAKLKKVIEDGEKDVIAAIEKAQQETQEQIEVDALRNVEVNITMMKRFIDPFDRMETGTLREPPWFQGKPPTVQQLETLRKNGMRDKDEKKLTFWRASQLIESIQERRKLNLCTVKQARILDKFGCDPNVSFDEAKRIIDKIAANGWKPLHAKI